LKTLFGYLHEIFGGYSFMQVFPMPYPMAKARSMRLSLLVTIKGAMSGINEKGEIIIEGEWVNDKKCGLRL